LVLFFKKELLPSLFSWGLVMDCLVLGAAAGGGFPQWNCGCRNCVRARSGDPAARPRTQASVAVSGDGARWLIVGASPDLRQQILANDVLAPPAGTRDSPIAGVVLVSADVDGIAGLLVLREQHRFRLFAPGAILKVLSENGIFASLDASLVDRVEIAPGVATDTGLGVMLTLLSMPGKVPLYQEAERSAVRADAAATYAARLESGGKTCIVAPACADLTDAVVGQLADADVLFFDGTLFYDKEMIDAGLGWKTGRRMGHVSVSGTDGALARLAGLRARKIFFHINNSNEMLLDDSAARRQVEAAGFEVGYDGMRMRA
jgi:pyrroloquinoline quinone biosynthesis protein B